MLGSLVELALQGACATGVYFVRLVAGVYGGVPSESCPAWWAGELVTLGGMP